MTAPPDGSDNAELGEMSADRVGELGALAVEHQPHPVQHHHALLLRRLDGHKAHRRPRHGLADRLGIRGVVLAALHIGLDVLRRHQADLVPSAR